MDVLRRIQAFNADRDPERLQIKYRKMRSGMFPFLRGTCHLFYDRLSRRGAFDSAPLTWICGDLHLENFGSYKGDNRLVYFDMNDFDEAVLAPATWDLVRLLASLWVGAEDASIDQSEIRRLGTVFLETYSTSLALGKAYWVERETATGLVRTLLDGLRERKRAQFLDVRTQRKGKRRILRVDGSRALPPTPAQRTAIMEFMAAFGETRSDTAFFNVLDVARRIAGTGSLGVDRYVILVEGKGSPDANYLLDLKHALPSAVAPHLKVVQPRWKTEAHRVVSLQNRLQGVSMAFLQPVVIGKQGYVLRGLQPSEDRITVGKTGRSAWNLEQLIGMMGRIVAWAQLRSAGREGSAIADELIDFGRRKNWKTKLLRASEDCVRSVRADSAIFNIAYDDGEFKS